MWTSEEFSLGASVFYICVPLDRLFSWFLVQSSKQCIHLLTAWKQYIYTCWTCWYESFPRKCRYFELFWWWLRLFPMALFGMVFGIIEQGKELGLYQPATLGIDKFLHLKIYGLAIYISLHLMCVDWFSSATSKY